ARPHGLRSNGEEDPCGGRAYSQGGFGGLPQRGAGRSPDQTEGGWVGRAKRTTLALERVPAKRGAKRSLGGWVGRAKRTTLAIEPDRDRMDRQSVRYAGAAGAAGAVDHGAGAPQAFVNVTSAADRRRVGPNFPRG